jgi:hypothetical protein
MNTPTDRPVASPGAHRRAQHMIARLKQTRNLLQDALLEAQAEVMELRAQLDAMTAAQAPATTPEAHAKAPNGAAPAHG